MATEIVYSDKLVEITQDSILFRNYYFPFGSKRVAFAEVGGVAVNEAAGMAEKWRIQGTMDFFTWFPRDWRRPTRDRIFFQLSRTQASDRIHGRGSEHRYEHLVR